MRIEFHGRHVSPGRRCCQRFHSGIVGFWHLVVLSSLLLLCLGELWLPTAQALSGGLGKVVTTPHTAVAAAAVVASSPKASETTTFAARSSRPCARRSLTTISEDVWRKAASDHRTTIQELLDPGLVDLDHPMMRPVRKYFPANNNNNDDDDDSQQQPLLMTMLDPKHPIYNFLVEYYGLKGLKGPKRLARWSPSIGLFFWDTDADTDADGNDSSQRPSAIATPPAKSRVRRIESLDDYHATSSAYRDSGAIAPPTNPTGRDETDRGIFLEGATPDDFGLTLYLQCAEWIDPTNNSGGDDPIYGGKSGILYRPIRYYDLPHGTEAENENDPTTTEEETQHQRASSDIGIHRKATSFVWYKSVLESTLDNEAVLHCYGLHEWAMQYHPEGAPPPPSGKYQAHLPLRVSRTVINSTVERKGLRCTHVDALRFFAPAAGPLNSHGAVLERQDQLELEQPGCVHAHMDLLKIALRIKPYCDPSLLRDILGVALRARSLDVGASPYDCSDYSGNRDGSAIPIIPVETPEGRSLYRNLQSELMAEAGIVRHQLLANYEAFGALAFATYQLERATSDPSDERFAKAEPGGKAWRHNLIDRSPERPPQPQGVGEQR